MNVLLKIKVAVFVVVIITCIYYGNKKVGGTEPIAMDQSWEQTY